MEGFMGVIKTDVLVCGGGCAGLVAALASARMGAKTLLIERAGFAGGIVTATGLPFFDGIAHQGSNRIVVRGIAMELAVKMGLCKAGDTHIEPHNPRIRNIEQFKLLADRLLLEHDNLQVLYHTVACDVVVRDGRIAGVRIANKDGLTTVEARQVIDTTGDGDIAAWAGAQTEKNDPLMPMTMHFRVGHVGADRQNMGELARASLIKAHEAGDLPLFYGPAIMFAFANDEAYFHAIRVTGDGTIAADLTRAEMQGRKDAWTIFECLKRDVPAFKDAYFIESGPYIGVRETRRLVGQHVLSEDDIQACRSFDDAIATGCWYLDVHPNKVTLRGANEGNKIQPEPYDIPYRALLSNELANLVVAGRCHSATAFAASSTRVNVTAMGLGEAAGTAAALSVARGVDLAECDGVKVRETLSAQGAGPFT
jgi:hypothetical protein